MELRNDTKWLQICATGWSKHANCFFLIQMFCLSLLMRGVWLMCNNHRTGPDLPNADSM